MVFIRIRYDVGPGVRETVIQNVGWIECVYRDGQVLMLHSKRMIYRITDYESQEIIFKAIGYRI